METSSLVNADPLSPLQARILVTRQLLFLAVRQNVARSFLPNPAKFDAPDQHLLEVCIAAACENVQLTDRLFEIVHSGVSAFGMIDYHNAFNAAIILELGCLCRQNGSTLCDRPQIGHTLDALQHAGQNGNEFARDCSTVLADFRRLSEKLIQEMSRRSQNIVFSPPTQNVPVPQALASGMLDVPASSAMSVPLVEGLSPGLDFEKVCEEFTNWLEKGAF